MDGRRIDDLAVLLAAPSRRGALRLLAAGALWATLGAVLGRFGLEEAAARCVPTGKKCQRGDRCCQSGRCKRGRCRCPRGFPTRCGKNCFSGEVVCCGDGFCHPDVPVCCAPTAAFPNGYCCPAGTGCCASNCCGTGFAAATASEGVVPVPPAGGLTRSPAALLDDAEGA